ncbi:hypothetical protein P153DRAFT_364724 [Dothidotthia symphoricarpi CBS 119687]|uniref:Uncharacterized protein n=1 Tax=Dothidotthia symphoricarpi CBS 119687 TaxID=1392245 RepID=A0A6A6AP73_9PLEO|nr:uncharacterized protein P153DRAFT_364724 [Dothidotthia symphoricarpi CBS 119687]KAF2132301.1 hypothetical protein P153DRAFT_364724 [Dothidotthia symphoricarpi CBS 119687]
MTEPTTNTQTMRTSNSGVEFRAAHLDVIIDSRNPHPPISPEFVLLRDQAATTWHAFEAAESHLPTIIDALDAEMLDYVSSHRRATAQQLQVHRDRIAIPRYEATIAEVERCCKVLEGEIVVLEEAARRESETVEGMATLQIDVPVMTSCLETTKKIVEVARAQLQGARGRLGE